MSSYSCRSATRGRWHCGSQPLPARLDWPRDRLEIQLLDDGHVDNHEALLTAATQAAPDGLKLSVLRRGERAGFKAGNLAFGLKHSQRALCGDLRRRFRARAGFPEAHRAGADGRSGSRLRPDPLGSQQPRTQLADPRARFSARQPFRHRTGSALPRRLARSPSTERQAYGAGPPSTMPADGRATR
jgi:hypothetical protein